MFAVIRHYHFDPKNGAEIDRQVREGFVPIIKKAPHLPAQLLDRRKDPAPDGRALRVAVLEQQIGAPSREDCRFVYRAGGSPA